jgi:HAMP domain-containing protein
MIDKSFQINFIVKFIVLIVSCAILSGLLLAVVYYVRYDMVVNEGSEILLRYIKPESPEIRKLDSDTPTVKVDTDVFAVRARNLYIVADGRMYPTYSPDRFEIQGEDILIRYKRGSKRPEPVSRLEYVLKGQIVARKAAPGLATALIGNARYAVVDEALFLVEAGVLYPTFNPGRYRIADGKLEEFSRNSESYGQPIGMPVYTLREGQIVQEYSREGKLVYEPVKMAIQSEFDRDNIDFDNIKGATDRFGVVFFALLFITIVFIAIAIVFGIFFSHRLAGPIYRIGISLDRMATGDFDFDVKLRKTDAFQHLAQKLNHLMHVLRAKGKAAAKPKSAAPATRSKTVPARKPAPRKK